MMQSPYLFELYVGEVTRDRLRRAEHAALLAHLPRAPRARPDLAARLRVASALRALAVRLDPSATGNRVFAVTPSR